MTEELTIEAVHKMKVTELRSELKARGVAVSGKKEELSNRLINLIKSQTVDNDNLVESFDETVNSPDKSLANDSIVVNDATALADLPVPTIDSTTENIESNKVVEVINNISNDNGVEESPVVNNEEKLTVAEDTLCSTENKDISTENNESEVHVETYKELDEKPKVNHAPATNIFGDSALQDEDDEQRELRELEEKKLREAVKLSMARQAVKKTIPSVERKSVPTAATTSSIDVSKTDTDPVSSVVPPPINSPTKHLRIDNFQRPLQLNALKAWLESRWDITLPSDSLWLNSIKTHCYVDFESVEIAIKCRELVHGLNFPPGNQQKLFADFTTIPSKDASGSAESQLKPGQWLVSCEKTVPPIKKIYVETGVSKSALAEADDGLSPRGDANGPLSGGKRKLAGVGASSVMMGMLKNAATTAANSIKTPTNRLSNIDGNEDVGFSTRKRRDVDGGSGALQDSQAGIKRARDVHEETGATQVSRDMQRRLGGRPGGDAGGEAQEDAGPGLALEDLFRKTKAVPHLFWLPAPDAEIERRKRLRA